MVLPAFQVDSYFDVITGKIPVEKYKDKIVLIGSTATGVGTPQVTPINTAMEPGTDPGAFGVEHPQRRFLYRARLGHLGADGRLRAGMLYLMIVMPRLKAGVAFVVTLVLVLALSLRITC